VSGHRSRALVASSLLLATLLLATSPATASRHHRRFRPVNKSLPRISGTPKVGGVLRASRGRWARASSFAYRWLVCDRRGRRCRTANARSRKYPLTGHDLGHRIRVTVVARNARGKASATSRATPVITSSRSNGGPTPTPTPGPPLPSTGPAGLHVSGNRLLNSSGEVVQLRGVNRSGSEYACIQGWGNFDGPSDAASVAAIASWHSNVVRIPINEDCWLGINGVASAYSGQNYINAILGYVKLLHQFGMYAELSLMWGAPGTNQATYQPGAPDEDHSPALWASLARTFRDDPNVILAPWGETIVDANCFLHGGVCEATYGPGNVAYDTAGMQQAVNVMRQAGYKGVISIPGIDYANNLTQWLSHEPSDPLGQLIAEAHVYGGNTCDSTSCLDSQMAPVAAKVPLIFGETGETFDDSECGSSHVSTFMNWADAHGAGYEAWTWDTWGTCGSLISDYNGTPANGYGSYVKSHYAALG
jgi:endoglucanase